MPRISDVPCHAAVWARRWRVGARGLLGLTQPALASLAKLGLSTIVDFERSRRPVWPIIWAIRDRTKRLSRHTGGHWDIRTRMSFERPGMATIRIFMRGTA